MNPVLKDLTELTKAKVISEETAENIRSYYSLKQDQSQGRQQIALGILGSLLVGLGIILIIAHNWDELSRITKTFLSFLPLILGQIAGGYVLLKKSEKIIWKEAVATFLFFSVGASISLISQVYNISGDLDSFLLTWMLLVLPLVYVFKASAISILYQIGITWYACLTGYGYNSSSGLSLYWLGLLLVIPHYLYLIKNKRESNFTALHHWTLPLSLTISLGTLAGYYEPLMYLAYFCLFNLYYQTENLNIFKDQNILKNGYRCLGASGMLILLFMLSYEWFWSDLHYKVFASGDFLMSPEFILSVSLVLALVVITFLSLKRKYHNQKVFTALYIPFVLIFITGSFSIPLPQILINLLIIICALIIIRDGGKENDLRYLNFGLLIFSFLIFCRFFDWNLSFVLRGIAFILVGSAFFLTNYIMIKSRRTTGINSRIS